MDRPFKHTSTGIQPISKANRHIPAKICGGGQASTERKDSYTPEDAGKSLAEFILQGFGYETGGISLQQTFLRLRYVDTTLLFSTAFVRFRLSPEDPFG